MAIRRGNKTTRQPTRDASEYEREPEETEDDEEEEETERPARGRGRGRATTTPRGGARDEDDEDEDEDEERPDVVGRGWAAGKAKRAKTATFPDRFSPSSEEDTLIKFLEDEPYAVYNQHWIERPGKKSFVCLEVDCPLCDIGDSPTHYELFNVVVLSRTPEVMSWEMRPRLQDQVAKFATSKKDGPLTRHYWAVGKSGTKSKVSYNFQVVKERDLEDDWGIAPLGEREVEKYRAQGWDSSSVRVSTRRELLDVCEEINDEDDED